MQHTPRKFAACGPHSRLNLPADFEILPSTLWDVEFLRKNLRASDRFEIEQSQKAFGRNVFESMRARCKKDNYLTLWRGSEIVGIGGISPNPKDKNFGVIWFLGTDLADTHWRSLTRVCAEFLKHFKKDWPALGNVVPSSATKRLKWLEFLGFDTSLPKAQISNIEFTVFTMRT